MTAAHSLNRTITTRLRGQCRLVDGQKILNRASTYVEHCGACVDGCDQRDDWSQLQGAIEVKSSHNAFKLRWPCPCCGVAVVETVDLPKLFEIASEIEADPACVRCRVELVRSA